MVGTYREKKVEAPKAIHESQVKGYEFSYQLVTTEGPFSFYRNIPYQLVGQPRQDVFEGVQKPQLILFITDSLGNEIIDAKVKYKIVGPPKRYPGSRRVPGRRWLCRRHLLHRPGNLQN